MKTKLMRYLSAPLAGLVLLAGCTRPHDELPASGTTLRVRLAPETLRDRQLTAGEEEIGSVTAFRFEEGTLQEIVEGRADGNGNHAFRLTGLAGELRFVANAASIARPETGSSLEAFDAIVAPTTALAGIAPAMTGRMTLEKPLPTLATVGMRRSVARIDLEATDSGVAVQRITIRGVADRGYLNVRPTAETPAAAERIDFTKAYTDGRLTAGRDPLLYVCEQTGPAATVEVLATFGGGLHRMTATLPATLERNHIYTLRVHGSGANAAITVTADGWESGEQTETSPALKGLIDASASTLDEGVRINAAGDTVRVSYLGGNFRLALRAEADAEVAVEGHLRGVTATVTPATRALQPAASVTVTADRRMPNEATGYLYLDIRRDDTHSGRVVVLFEPNPTRITGLSLDEEGVCDYGRYIDGELGRIELPAGKQATLEFDAGEDPWMTLADAGSGTLRLLGGWKPNDPKADGRTQEGRLVIADADGSHAERYTVRRINQGLPVVRIGGQWWCKYNLRGNVRSFEDQITVANDPAADTRLADYLASCSDEELLRLLGDQYQGGNRQGLPLRHNGTSFYYEGMQGSAQHFGALDPTYMAPDGYEVPDYDDYAFFSGSDNYNIGGVGSRSYNNRRGDRINVRIIERDATFLGQPYGTIAFYEFTSGEGCWVLDGLGHQWNTTAGNISRMMILLATSGNSTSSWLMEGYAQSEKANQNWLKFVSQNATKTRTVRCIKTPVEYIYE